MALAYLDTHSGIAGDMTLAALVDAGADSAYVREQVASLPGLENVRLDFYETKRHCFRATALRVDHPAEHAHRHLSDIENMLNAGRLTPRERTLALRVFRKLGEAEAKVHGTSIDHVHFHEVGAIDSIVDIVGTAVALVALGIERVLAAPPPLGTGTIRIAHGDVSIPAPATGELLRGIPIRSSDIECELTTPTGAALLATLVDGFGPLPGMQISRIGYGAGQRDLKEQANVLRAIIGAPHQDAADQVVLLETNLDDATGEQLGFAIEKLWDAGALDVFTIPIGMKKNRPGTLLSVIALPESREKLEDCLFLHSGSLGIRRTLVSRRKLSRKSIEVNTPLGTVRVKVAWSDNSAPQHVRYSPEYEDCRRLALEHDRRLESVYMLALQAAGESEEVANHELDRASEASQQIEFSNPRASDNHHH